MTSKFSAVFYLITFFFFIGVLQADELVKAESLSNKSKLDFIFQNKLTGGDSPFSQVINNTSLKQLTTHRWKLMAVRGIDEPTLRGDETVFEFSEDFKFNVMLPCSYIQGKYQAEDSGHFVLRQLNFSNRDCDSDKQQEVLLKTMLLSADEFFINDQNLILGGQGKSMLAFVTTNKTIDKKEFDFSKKKSKSNTKTKAKIKKKSGAKTKVHNSKSSHKKSVAQPSVKTRKKAAHKALH